jgi:hypothetical protein
MSDRTAPVVEPSRLRSAAAFAVSEALVLLALLGPLMGWPWWQGFRAYAYPDQLTYASIATNWSLGDGRLVEPFTQTGASFYPSLWYQLMGLVSRLTGVPVYVAWTVMGIVAVSAAVLIVGFLALRMSRRAWAPLLPALAIFTGTLSAFVAGYWFTSLLNHAVLWGPIGALFTLNSEAVGVCLVVIAMTMLMATDPQNGATYRPWLIVAAAALLGLLANIHTYAFFSGVILATSFAALLALSRSRSRSLIAVTVCLVALVLAIGARVAPVTGPLPVLGLLVLAFAPAGLTLARGKGVLATLTVLAFCLAASPQLVRTAAGLLGGDPFLTFRQLSSRGLGVAIPSGILAALPVLLLGALCGIALWRRHQHSKNALLLALLVGGAIMSQNDRWGFNQEPYRFWIVFLILAAMLMTPVLAWSVTQRTHLVAGRRVAFVGLGITAAVIWAASLVDVVSFWHYAAGQGVFSMQDARAAAVRELVHEREGLLMTSACLEPQVLKVMTGARVAHYNRGLAWPPNAKELYAFQDKARRAAEDPELLQRAGVSYALTDSSCLTEWDFTRDPRMIPVTSKSYVGESGAATLTLWQVQPG